MSNKKHIFTALEKKIFLDILKKHKTIIENKDTNGATLQAKNATWNNVTQEFNASPYATLQATSKQLRRLWMNLKQRQREAIAKLRQHRLNHRGMPLTNGVVTDPDISQIEPAFFVKTEDTFDSDTVSATPSSMLEILMEEPQSVSTLETPDETIIGTPPMTVSNGPSLTLPMSLSHAIPTPPSGLSQSQHKYRNISLEKEYKDRHERAKALHLLEVELMGHKIREAKANADLAELLLKQHQHSADVKPKTNE